MTRRNVGWMVLLASAAALATGLYVRHISQPADATVDPARGAAMVLALTLPNPAGKDESLAQYRGKLLVVNFWATWCVPCREEMPEFVHLQNEFGAKGIQFVGIAVDDADKVSQFSKDIGLNYQALIGGYGALELSRALGNRVMALPFTIVIGRDGKVELTHLGPFKGDQLRRIISQYI